jgi:hypothetical protein
MKLLSFNEFIKESYSITKYDNYQVINCGGSFGHMQHPYDDLELTFSEIKNIIEQALQGQLNKEVESTEKLDGQAIAVSWKNNQLIAARNKGNRKHGGAAGLTVQQVIDKFAGRGALSDGFSFAIQDLNSAISKISSKERELIFKNGYAFMDLEVIYPESSNVINYDAPILIFHSATTYDEDGNPISVDKTVATKLQKLIKDVNSDIQDHYIIRPPAVIHMPKVIDFEKNKSKYLSIINKLQSKDKLSDDNSISDYISIKWNDYIFKKITSFDESIDSVKIDKLINRWAFSDNSYTVRDMKKELPEKFLEWALKFTKKEFKQVGKDILYPFEELFLSLGVEVLKNATGFLAVNPDKVVQDIKIKLEDIQKQIEKSGDIELINKLKYQLNRLQSIGGFDAIVPSEGIVFQYNGKTYKLTGAFASVNNILGTFKFGKTR